MGIVAVIGAALTLLLEILLIFKDHGKVTTKEENDKLELRKQELPKLAEAISKRDTTAYLLSLSRVRNARKK